MYIFQGLYKKDERFGPGKLTYTDGTQDVGLWSGEKLIKLLSHSDERFSMKHHPDLDYNPQDHRHTICMEDRYYNK